MLAFQLYEESPEYGCLLVFAESRGKAKSLGVRCGPFMDWSFPKVSCRRIQKYDGLFDKPCVIETNNELPPGTEHFYYDEPDL